MRCSLDPTVPSTAFLVLPERGVVDGEEVSMVRPLHHTPFLFLVGVAGAEAGQSPCCLPPSPVFPNQKLFLLVGLVVALLTPQR